MKKSLIPTALAIALGSTALPAMADDTAVLNVIGTVSAGTCIIQLDSPGLNNGNSTLLLTMDSVSTKDFSTGHPEADLKKISLSFSDCALPQSTSAAGFYLTNPPSEIDSVGNLINKGDAAGLSLRFLDNNRQPLPLTGYTTASTLIPITLSDNLTNIGKKDGVASFYVEYYAETGTVSAGSFAATATLDVHYH